MPQSLAPIFIHLIFSTKERKPLISKVIKDELNAYMVGILRKLDCTPLLVNPTEDHVHILFSLSRTKTLAKVVADIKAGSSKWIKSKGESFCYFQ